jgi:S-adenosylmethionine synthetase
VDLIIRGTDGVAAGSGPVEVVERKGLGHPDTICDAVAEQVSLRLCRYYLERFGEILHHNVDKVLLVGGRARAAFGGGEMVEPLEIYLAGRATEEFRGDRIPLHEIAVGACREWIGKNLPRLNLDRDVKIIPRLRPGSADLVRLFNSHRTPLANDTSCGVGFAPLTDLERVVLAVERALNSRATKDTSPEIGTDIKVMGVRRGARIDLTIGCAFVDRFVRDVDEYLRKKADALELALEAARRVTRLEVHGVVNAADDVESGDVFLTVTGTSAEAGDDGEAGRGNRTCGLITPYRPMTLEAAAGKNPVTHVGKLYNVLAQRIAAAIVADLPGAAGAECVLVSHIGRPVSDPAIVDVRLACGETSTTTAMQQQVRDIVKSELDRLSELRDALLQGSLPVF